MAITKHKHKIKSNGNLLSLFIFLVFFNASFLIAYDLVKAFGKQFKLGERWWHLLIILILLLAILAITLIYVDDFDIGESETME
jgi:hypothetical protein